MGSVVTERKTEIINAGIRGLVSIVKEHTDSRFHVVLLRSSTGNRFYIRKMNAGDTRVFQYRYNNQSRAESEFDRIVNGVTSDISQLPKESYKEYKPNATLTFVLTETKTIVVVNPNSPVRQTFLVQCEHRNYLKQKRELRELIMKKKIKTVADLIDYCRFRPGNGSGGGAKMLGLELVPTKLERHI